jgi:hypothetical protein
MKEVQLWGMEVREASSGASGGKQEIDSSVIKIKKRAGRKARNQQQRQNRSSDSREIKVVGKERLVKWQHGSQLK